MPNPAFNLEDALAEKVELDPDKTPLPFGKYKGLTPEQVANEDPSYIIWLYEEVTNKMTGRPFCSESLVEDCLDQTHELLF